MIKLGEQTRKPPDKTLFLSCMCVPVIISKWGFLTITIISKWGFLTAFQERYFTTFMMFRNILSLYFKWEIFLFSQFLFWILLTMSSKCSEFQLQQCTLKDNFEMLFCCKNNNSTVCTEEKCLACTKLHTVLIKLLQYQEQLF